MGVGGASVGVCPPINNQPQLSSPIYGVPLDQVGYDLMEVINKINSWSMIRRRRKDRVCVPLCLLV